MKVMDATAILFSFKIALCGERAIFYPAAAAAPLQRRRERGEGGRRRSPHFFRLRGSAVGASGWKGGEEMFAAAPLSTHPPHPGGKARNHQQEIHQILEKDFLKETQKSEGNFWLGFLKCFPW